jgi:hypothetical protein
MKLKTAVHMRLKYKNMHALRQIVDVKNHSLNIVLPNDFAADKVEVIILSVEEQPLKNNNIASLRGKLKLTEEQYNNFQQNVKDSRGEWDRTI